ncbi:MAG TPA: amino acid kinase family protein, partial [Xylella taiwanensis]
MLASPTADRWIVLKFGGTSVSRRHRWDTIAMLVKKRVEEHGARVLIVVSALSGVTNELTAIAEGVVDSAQRVAALEQRHRDFLSELGLDAEAVLGTRFTILWDLLDDARAVTRSLDWQAELLGQGELLSSTLGAAYLRVLGVDIDWTDA